MSKRVEIAKRDLLTDVNIREAEEAFKKMLQSLGLDINDEHLRDTPRRVVKMYRELFFENEPWKFTTFENTAGDNGIVLVRDIPFTSLCAHHFALFTGVAHVAYVPRRRLVGLSKLARVVTSFAKGPNVQEMIGARSADFLMRELDPVGVAVILKAQHTCMTERGAKAHGSSTVTSALRGCFYDEPSARAELMSLIAL